MGKGPKSILIADGDVSVRRQAADLLQTSGYQVFTAADGPEAWQILSSTPVDMVIADVLLPKTDGYRFCTKIHQTPELEHIRVLFFSESFLGPRERDLATAVGVSGFVDKPMNAAQGLAVIHEQFASTTRGDAEASIRVSEYQPLYHASLACLVDTLKKAASKTGASENDALETESVVGKGDAPYRHIASMTSDYVYSMKLTDGPSAVFDWKDGAFEATTGYSDTEIRTLTDWIEVIFPEDRQRYRETLQNGFADDETLLEYRIRTKKGGICWLRDRSRPVFDPVGHQVKGRIGAVHDFTDAQATAANLQRLATAVECATESILITDGEGTIDYVNPAFEKITGYRSHEIIGQKPSVLKSGHHDSKFYQQMWKTIKGGQTWMGNLINKRKDGSFYHLEATISPITDANGTITNFVAVRRDISHEKEMEQQLRQSQKLEAIGTLAGGIAHDFNNILAAMFGYCELSLAILEQDSVVYRNIQEILRASERARDLVKQILTFSRQQDQDYQPVQVKTLLKEAVKFIRASLPATITIREAISCDPIVMGDPTQIHQVIINLLTNAGQAMHASGGRMDVQLDPLEIDSGFVGQSMLAPGEYLQLMVRDTGPGMSPEILQRIFDPFFTTREVNKGTGLGLSVVHGIVKRHGGAIHAFSRKGAGALFKVFLPVVKASPKPLQDALRPIPKGDETILFVDDEAMIVDSARRILESLGYGVTTTTSSLEALSLVREDPLRFDLVITDMTMPQMTGETLASKILDLRQDMPIILCTGFSAKTDEAKALAKGLRAFVFKPILRRDLAETIRRVLDG